MHMDACGNHMVCMVNVFKKKNTGAPKTRIFWKVRTPGTKECAAPPTGTKGHPTKYLLLVLGKANLCPWNIKRVAPHCACAARAGAAKTMHFIKLAGLNFQPQAVQSHLEGS